MTRVNVIVVAGGHGRRFGGPKQFELLGGEPVLRVTVRRFAGLAGLTRLIVVAGEAEHDRCRSLLAPLALPLVLAAAGAERQHSVAAGVAALEDACDVAVVHDAVRPLVTPAAIAACVEAARARGAAVLAEPVPDTVKRSRAGVVVETVPRADLWLAQTPQAFHADLLRRAHADAARAGAAATDDAALVERLGVPVAIVPGEPTNRKITTPADLVWAEALISRERGGAG